MKRLRTLIIALLVTLAIAGCETNNPTTRNGENGGQQPAVGQTTDPANQPTTNPTTRSGQDTGPTTGTGVTPATAP